MQVKGIYCMDSSVSKLHWQRYANLLFIDQNDGAISIYRKTEQPDILP